MTFVVFVGAVVSLLWTFCLQVLGHQGDLHVSMQSVPMLDVLVQIWSSSLINEQSYQPCKEQLACSRHCVHSTEMHYVHET